jgi:hypothetical protein
MVVKLKRNKNNYRNNSHKIYSNLYSMHKMYLKIQHNYSNNYIVKHYMHNS